MHPRYSLCCSGRGLRRLLLGLVHRLPVLLLVLLDLGAGLILRYVLRPSQCLSGAVSCLLCLSVVAGECRPDGRYSGIAQRCGIIPAGGAPNLGLDCAKRIRDLDTEGAAPCTAV
jgi:hypothetical protein